MHKFDLSHLKFIFLILDNLQNATIEERVSLLELQVVELDENVVDLDEDVDFLFGEQLIQDERLLNLEEATDSINAELLTMNDELEGKVYLKNIFSSKDS